MGGVIILTRGMGERLTYEIPARYRVVFGGTSGRLVASFPGPAQLSVACSTEKPWRAWYLFSREHDVIGKWRNFAELTGCVARILNPLHAQRSVCKTVASR